MTHPLNELVQLLRAPHGAGKPAQVDAAELLEAQAVQIIVLRAEIDRLKERVTAAAWALNPGLV